MSGSYVHALGRLSARRHGIPRSQRWPPSIRLVSVHGARNFSAEERPTEEQTSEPLSSPTKIVFPWRHEDTPLPRLIKGTTEYLTQGQLLSSVTTKTGHQTLNRLATAFVFLNVPFYELLFFGIWKAELSDSVSWAFKEGMASLLWQILGSASDECSIGDDEGELSFHAILEGTTTYDKTEDLDEEFEDIPLQNIFEEKLITLYQSAKENMINQEVEIYLKTIPYSAELVSLYAIPYISRRNTKSDKALLDFHKEMLKKRPIDRVEDLRKLRKDKYEKGIMESTVIVQVLVWCNEVFYVKDLKSGKVIQGADDNDTSRNVPHLVRMESTVVTIKDEEGVYINKRENWRITDIDDLLGGNLIA